jgi:hypothetical protein
MSTTRDSSRNAGRDSTRIMIDLLKMIVSSAPAQTIIDYIERYQIDINSYLPDLRGQYQMPLIYYCTSNPQLDELFFYLLERQVDLKAPIIGPPEYQIELLFYSQIQYIPILVENGCTLDQNQILANIHKLLIKGNINKLIALHKYGAIDKTQIAAVIQTPNIIFEILDQLYEKIYLISQAAKSEAQFETVYAQLAKSYITTFKFLIKNNVAFNQIKDEISFSQNLLNSYLTPVIRFFADAGLFDPNTPNFQLLHFSNFKLDNRQVMKYIYNQKNFDLISEIITRYYPKRIVVRGSGAPRGELRSSDS